MDAIDISSEDKFRKKLRRPRVNIAFIIAIATVVITGLQLGLAFIYIDASYKSALYQGQIENIRSMSKIISEQTKYIRLCEAKGFKECSKRADDIIDKMTSDGVYISDAIFMPAKITALRFRLYNGFSRFLMQPTCYNARNYLILLNQYLDKSRDHFQPDEYSRRDMFKQSDVDFIELYTNYNSVKCSSFLVDPETEGYLSSLPPNWLPASDNSLFDRNDGFEQVNGVSVMKMPN